MCGIRWGLVQKMSHKVHIPNIEILILLYQWHQNSLQFLVLQNKLQCIETDKVKTVKCESQKNRAKIVLLIGIAILQEKYKTKFLKFTFCEQILFN